MLKIAASTSSIETFPFLTVMLRREPQKRTMDSTCRGKGARHDRIRLRDSEEGKIEHPFPAIGKEQLLLKPESRHTPDFVLVDEVR